MTKLLETAFQKLSTELNESEQDLLARVLLARVARVGWVEERNPAYSK